MQKKAVNKSLLMLLAAALLIVCSIGTYYIRAESGNSAISPEINSLPNGDSISIAIEEPINPPLGNNTNLENISGMFSSMALYLPIEITIVFVAEIIMGSALKLDPKKMNLKRLGIMLGTAAALSVICGIVHYTLVYPAMHDIPIHQYTYDIYYPATNQTITYPQYGGAETFFSYGVDIIVMLAAALIIVGVHFPAFKYIQRFNYLNSGVSTALPAIIYPIIWNMLINQVTANQYIEQLGNIWTLMLIFAVGFILIVLLLLIWKLTLIGTTPPESTEQQKKDNLM
ncbi:MAG: hypothetical protein ACFFDW_13450 [Candidatus Thorarchaeota archaeon]